MHVLTFVTPKPESHFDQWIKKSHPEIQIEDRVVLDDHAVQWHIKNPLSKFEIDTIRQEFKIDIFQTDGTPIKLFMADMDSTIVSGETLDDMAALVGVGEMVADITARAMAGELDFEGALNARVQLLKGQSSSIIDAALADMRVNDGAKDLLNHLKSKNIYCVLISGGFTQFTSQVANDLGFDDHFGNELIVKDGNLMGAVTHPILDKNFKLQKLNDLKNSMGLNDNQIMAVGDGANDLPMLHAAGTGVSYFGKPLLRETLINQIHHTNLSSLGYLA